jgi:hypothetical protein
MCTVLDSQSRQRHRRSTPPLTTLIGEGTLNARIVTFRVSAAGVRRAEVDKPLAVTRDPGPRRRSSWQIGAAAPRAGRKARS